MNSLKKTMTTSTLNSLELGDTTIDYIVIRKWKQHLSFRFFDLTLVVYAPYTSSTRQIEEALRSKAHWILKHVTHRRAQQLTNDQFRILGDVVSVRYRTGSKLITQWDDKVLTITHPASQSEKSALAKAVARLAETTITAIFNQASLNAGLTPQKLEFKHLRSSLGRCSSTKRIVLARRLIHYPPEVIEAVCYHELAHLIHMNHSKRFYALLESWMPNYRQIMKNARNYPSVSTID